MKKSPILAGLFIVVNMIIPIICAFFGMQNKANIIENKASEICSKVNKFSSNQVLYTQTDIINNSTTDYESLARNFYSVSYGYNNTKWMKQVIVCGRNESFCEFSVSLNEIEYSSKTALLDAVGYTNNHKRFESLDISLFMQKTRAEELTYDKTIFDSVIYLPDSISDFYIHALSLSSYEDLLDLNTPLIVTYKNGQNSLQRKYKITNIFNVEGFGDNKEKTSQFTNDLNALLKSFAITPDSFFFNHGNIGTICLGLIQSKKYCLIHYFDVINSYLVNYKLEGDIYFVSHGERELVSSDFIELISPETKQKANFGFIISISISFFILLTYYIYLFACIGKNRDWRNYCIVLFLSLLFFTLTFELICRLCAAFMFGFTFCLFANKYLFLSLIIECIFCALYLLFFWKKGIKSNLI